MMRYILLVILLVSSIGCGKNTTNECNVAGGVVVRYSMVLESTGDASISELNLIDGFGRQQMRYDVWYKSWNNWNCKSFVDYYSARRFMWEET